MATLSLRVSIDNTNVTKTMQFDPATSVYDACRIIKDKTTEVVQGQAKDYGLFLSDDDAKKGVWLEAGRSLDYYLLRNGDTIEFRKKLRPLRVRMLDGTVKTVLVDDSQPVANLMVVICTKIGITNHDEYSLVLDDGNNDVEYKANYGTLTLKRRKEEKERDAKMDQLRKKLRTDDEVNWIDPSKTLREQGLDETQTVLLRRKFFFSDQNIDSRDPVQLNLLYVQARDAIIDGTHPVTQEKACEFAGVQCQIQFGDHVEMKHKSGFLDLKEFLPQSYVKVKGIEKKVFAEHKRRYGDSELDAKVEYTKTARDLPTYGVTFFLVKEKMKGKNKLVPRLLGVTKDSVLRLDEKTKEILKTWPLTTVRRWGASPNTFTLDFGDYSDQYYSVQTTEAEQIQQIIAGYIDIILKKKQAKDHFGIEGDEGSTMVEDSVSPLKATILQQHERSKVGKVNTESVAKPAVMRAGADGARPYGTGHMAGAQYTTVSGQVNLAHAPPTVQQSKISSVLSEPQRALLSTISASIDVVSRSEMELAARAQIPELGSDSTARKWKETTLDTSKQNVSSQLAAMNAATAQVVTLTSGPTDEVDHTAVGAAITTIASNLPEMTKEVKMIAALIDDTSTGDRLLDAARKLCSAFSDLLRAAEPETKEPRQNLLNAASRVGEASHQVLYTIGEETQENKELQDVLLSLAKAVANTTAALVLKAKNIAATCEDQQTQNRVIGAATQCALATSQLVACAKVVAPTLYSTACQEQLTAAVREVAKAVENLAAVCGDTCADRQLMEQLTEAAADVTRSLDELLEHIARSGGAAATETVQETSVRTIIVATDRLFASSGDAAEMVRQARLLGQATAQLIQSIKGEAEKQADSEVQRRLLAAAKTLADATAKMVEAARQCAGHPHDAERQDELRRAAEELRDVTSLAAATPALRARLLSRLQQTSRRAAAAANQCLAAAASGAAHNSNAAGRDGLAGDCRDLNERIPQLLEAARESAEADPEDALVQTKLIDSAERFLQPAAHVVQSSRAVLPTLSDRATALQLDSASQRLGGALGELKEALVRARSSSDGLGGLGLESASRIVAEARTELEELRRATVRPKPLPGETAEGSARRLAAGCKSVTDNMAQLLSAAAQSNESYASQSARDTAYGLREISAAVRGVVATTTTTTTTTDARGLVDAACEAAERTALLVDETSMRGFGPEVTAAAKQVSASLSRCVGWLPGQRDVDAAIASVLEASAAIHRPSSAVITDKSYGQLQAELNSAAATLNEASSEVVVSVRSPARLSESSRDFAVAFRDLLGVSMEMAGQTKDEGARVQMVASMRTVSTSSSELLATAKSVSADPELPNGKNQLAAAARAVTDGINSLVEACTSAVPGQNECDGAVRNIQATRPLLDDPCEPVNDASYYECLDAVMDKSKSLGDGMSGIANHAKKSDYDGFGDSVRATSRAICGLVEAAAQSAYLVGVSDPSSAPGRPGLVDQAQFARAAQAIRQGCQALADGAAGQQQVLTAATVIAKHTSALCNACRTASNKTSNPVAKRHFVQSAKEVANSTAALVKEIKTLDAEYSDANRERCARATRPLLEAVEGLRAYASGSEFATVPARISPQARRAQEPIVEAARRIIDGSCSVLAAAKSLAVLPTDPPTWQLLAAHSKSVSDGIKRLVSAIRDRAPGQAECDAAIAALSSLLRSLDAAVMEAVSQTLEPRTGSTLHEFAEQVGRAAAELRDRVEPVRRAAKHEAENIGRCVDQLVRYFEPLVSSAVGAASHVVSSKRQAELLDRTKTAAESALQLLYAAKDCGGNPRALAVHPEVDEFAGSAADALDELAAAAERLSTESGVVTGVVDSITRAVARLSDRRASFVAASEESYVDFQTRMVEDAKEVARVARDMTAADSARLGPLCADLSHCYARLAADAAGAAAAATNGEVAVRLRDVVQALGLACADLVRLSARCPTGADLADGSRVVSERVSQLLATLQSGSRGTQACINAASTVSGIIGDLDTTIMFATAGTLHADSDHDSFSDHRENILKTAKALVEDTKTLVAGAASSQEQLAVAAQNAVTTIVQLAEVVKFGAASLGSDNPDSQVMLINAVKDVASALGDLIQATKAASGKPINDPAMAHLKESAKVMVTNVTSLLKTVKAVEDEHTRGTRALESTVEAIAQEIRTLLTGDSHKSGVTAEDLLRCTKSITLATTRAVAAGNSNKQDDIIAAANTGRKAISDMLVICKSAAYGIAETVELRQRTLQAGQDTAQQYRELLLAILNGTSADARHTLPPISRRIAQCVTELVAVAEILKGTDWVDPDDPTVIAENELLGAAASIDAAAKKLASLRPRKSVKEADESLNFDEMILEAAKSIAAATSALVKAASAAQKELIESGKVSRRPLTSSDDGQWSEGLVSAARMVAAATHSLVESANALVQGSSGEEKLISSAKQVASSTAHLLVACKVKAEAESETTRRLQSAGQAVIRSTDNLVRAAQRAIDQEEERCLVLNRRMVGGIAQEINARSEVLRIERQLEEARGKLNAIRQAKYKLRTGGEGSNPSEDTDDYSSPAPVYEGFTSRYETIDRTHHQQQQQQHQHHASYNDTGNNFSDLISPEKVNTLERNKKDAKKIISTTLKSEMSDAHDGYGTNNANHHHHKTEYYSYSDGSPKFVPQGESYKYDYVQSSAQPVRAYPTTEKYFTTSTPNSTFETFKNGSADHQVSSYSTVEYINEPPVLTESDSLEQRMLKQSVTQKIVQKKTVQMTSSSKQETSTKSFRFE